MMTSPADLETPAIRGTAIMQGVNVGLAESAERLKGYVNFTLTLLFP